MVHLFDSRQLPPPPVARCRKAGLMLAALAALALGGCKAAHMVVPEELQGSSSTLAVEGRWPSLSGNSFGFGPWRVTEVRRGWTQTDGNSASSGGSEVRTSKAKQKYGFSIAGPGRPARAVQCVTTARWSEMETDGLLGGGFGVEFSAEQQLACTLTPGGGMTPAKLALSQSGSAGDTALHGTMTDGATRIDIAATHALDATPLRVRGPAGYVFRIGGRTVGAVEVINAGTVWLDDSLAPETRSALAAASAVMLLYQDIKESSQAIQRM